MLQSSKKLKIGVFGIGSIGSVISTVLKEQNEYFYFNRSNKKRIEVQYKLEVITQNINIHKVNSFYELDWLIVCIKEYHFKEAEKDLKYLIHPNTKIAIIRNGINLKEPFLKYTKEENIVECMIDCPIQTITKEKYIQLKTPKITVKKGMLSNELESLFEKGKIEFNQVKDYKTENWKKIIESSALGGILTLSGETTWIFKDSLLLDLYRKTIREGILVARLEGALIKKGYEEDLVKKLLEYPEIKGSSMLTDRINGNPIEINAKNGIISAYGKKHKIKTDINDLITMLLKYTNNKG